MEPCGQCGSSKKRTFPIAAEGFPSIAASIFVILYVGALGFPMGALFFFVVTVFLVSFFRDPHREIPDEAGAVVSPADGKVVQVRILEDREYSGEKRLKISVFMNVFNVHVNRIPMDARVRKIAYFPGKFFSADLDKASKDNERNAVHLELKDGRRVTVVQIAGLVARRIVCKISEGDVMRRGERFGIICFGSRVDVYLPPDTHPAVGVGDKVLAGESILGHLS